MLANYGLALLLNWVGVTNDKYEACMFANPLQAGIGLEPSHLSAGSPIMGSTHLPIRRHCSMASSFNPPTLPLSSPSRLFERKKRCCILRPVQFYNTNHSLFLGGEKFSQFSFRLACLLVGNHPDSFNHFLKDVETCFHLAHRFCSILS